MEVLTVGMMVCDVPIANVPSNIFQLESVPIIAQGITTGGDALNVAVTLAKLGVDAGIVGHLGKDMNGRSIMEQIQAYGVNTKYVIWEETYNTAVSYLLLDEEGEKHSLSDIRIYEALTAEAVPDEAIAQAKIVHFGSAFQMKQMDDGGTLKLFQRAHKYGKLTSMDAAIIAGVAKRELLLEQMDPVFAETDIFFPSYQEAAYLSNYSEPREMAEFFKNRGIKLFGVKLGAQGCYVTDYKREFQLPCFTDFKAADTTGAGDSFMGGLLCGITKGWNIERCARFASAVAAHNVAVIGATAGVPDFQTVMDFLQKKGYE